MKMLFTPIYNYGILLGKLTEMNIFTSFYLVDLCCLSQFPFIPKVKKATKQDKYHSDGKQQKCITDEADSPGVLIG